MPQARIARIAILNFNDTGGLIDPILSSKHMPICSRAHMGY